MIDFENLKNANSPLMSRFIEAFEDVLDSGVYVMGPQLKAFEQEFTAAFNLGHVAGVGSGYDAITLAIRALGIEEGEAIIPANTYMATALAVVRAGLRPVFAEPDPSTMLIDPKEVEKAISSSTRLIVPVHMFGLACDMDAIRDIAFANSLAIVEDCAQAHGTFYKGESVGTFGYASAWSFYPTKNLGALGDGGAVASSRPEVIERVKVLRNYGAKVRADSDFVGMNSRMDEMQAAFLRVKFSSLGLINSRKNQIAEYYDRNLGARYGRASLVDGCRPARSVYPITCTDRDGLAAFLLKRNIKTLIHYPKPLWRQKALAEFSRGEYPVAGALCATSLSLPLSAALSDSEVEEIASAVNAY